MAWWRSSPVRAARETSKFQNRSHLTNSRSRYMADIFPIRRKTLSNQSINQSIVHVIIIPYGPQISNWSITSVMHYFFPAAERCLSFQYYYRTDQFYNDGYDSTLTVTSSGSSTALLKIGDANTPLNKWTAVKVTVPSTPDLKVR